MGRGVTLDTLKQLQRSEVVHLLNYDSSVKANPHFIIRLRQQREGQQLPRTPPTPGSSPPITELPSSPPQHRDQKDLPPSQRVPKQLQCSKPRGHGDGQFQAPWKQPAAPREDRHPHPIHDQRHDSEYHSQGCFHVIQIKTNAVMILGLTANTIAHGFFQSNTLMKTTSLSSRIVQQMKISIPGSLKEVGQRNHRIKITIQSIMVSHRHSNSNRCLVSPGMQLT